MGKLNKIINENVNRFILQETYSQLSIPFDGVYTTVNGKDVPKKRNYEYFIDYLEDNGRYGNLQSKYPNIKNSGIPQFLATVSDDECLEIASDCSDMDETYYILYESGDFDEFFETPDFFTQPIDELKSFRGGFEDVLDIVTEKGESAFKQLVRDYLLSRVEWEYFTIQNGLVYVERAITLHQLQSHAIFYNGGNLYEYLNNKYHGGVGICWSWNEGGGEEYDGNLPETIVLHGWVRVEDIDWYNVIYFANWVCKDEQEMRLNKGTLIQIDSITVTEGLEKGKRLPLKGSLIVKA